MAVYVLACDSADYDPQAGTCAIEQWVIQDVPSWMYLLPTVEQATQIGGAMLLAVSLVMAAGLLLPPRESDD